jgi:phosphomethylpyrimidine synthase
MTQLEQAKRGTPTPELKQVAMAEGISHAKLMRLVSSGRVVIPANSRHKRLKPIGIGAALRTKVNANIGTSPSRASLAEELEKLAVCKRFGADTVMDLSTGGDIDSIRRGLIKRSPMPVGTVPIYQAVVEKGLGGMNDDHFLNALEKHAKQGVDFATVHCGITREAVPLVEKRKHGIVSRGGSMLYHWMLSTGRENPFFANFDSVLDIAEVHGLTLSLGDALRPGCIGDATDRAQISELKLLGALAKKARRRNVQIIIEGPGHVPMNEIEKNILLQKKYCNGAPFYVLGPLVTDIGFGYDHITAAIGGAMAAFFGASFLCYVTPSEHLSLPSVGDVKEGIIASRIAAHAADIARGVPRAGEWDKRVSEARKRLKWRTLFRLSLDAKKAESYRKRSRQIGKECSMCGKYCALR